MTEQLTDLCFPELARPLALRVVRLSRSGRPKILNKTRKSIEWELLQPGLADWSRRNKEYRDLLDAFKVNEVSNEDISEAYMNKYHSNDNSLPVDPRDYPFDRPSPAALTCFDYKLISLRIRSGWSTRSICAKLNIPKSKLKEVFSDFE